MKKMLLSLTMAASCMVAQAQTFTNSGMENWVNYMAGLPPAVMERPQGWFSTDSLISTFGPLIFNGNTQKQLYKSTQKHSGTFSARLVSLSQDTTVLPGMLANAQFQLDLVNFDPNDPLSALSYQGGTPINQRIQTVSAWVNYDSYFSSDQGILSVLTVLAGQGAGGADSVVGEGFTVIPHTNNTFVQVHAGITYDDPTVVPDKIVVVFSSSNFLNIQDSSSLWVDDVTMSTTAGVQQLLLDGESFEVYPNPAKDVMNFNTSITQPLQLSIVDARGALMTQRQFTRNAQINTAAWTSGMYYYSVHNREGVMVRSGKLMVE